MSALRAWLGAAGPTSEHRGSVLHCLNQKKKIHSWQNLEWSSDSVLYSHPVQWDRWHSGPRGCARQQRQNLDLMVREKGLHVFKSQKRTSNWKLLDQLAAGNRTRASRNFGISPLSFFGCQALFKIMGLFQLLQPLSCLLTGRNNPPLKTLGTNGSGGLCPPLDPGNYIFLVMSISSSQQSFSFLIPCSSG